MRLRVLSVLLVVVCALALTRCRREAAECCSACALFYEGTRVGVSLRCLFLLVFACVLARIRCLCEPAKCQVHARCREGTRACICMHCPLLHAYVCVSWRMLCVSQQSGLVREPCCVSARVHVFAFAVCFSMFVRAYLAVAVHEPAKCPCGCALLFQGTRACDFVRCLILHDHACLLCLLAGVRRVHEPTHCMGAVV
jgi:hypothetical protein